MYFIKEFARLRICLSLFRYVFCRNVAKSVIFIQFLTLLLSAMVSMSHIYCWQIALLYWLILSDSHRGCLIWVKFVEIPKQRESLSEFYRGHFCLGNSVVTKTHNDPQRSTTIHNDPQRSHNDPQRSHNDPQQPKTNHNDSTTTETAQWKKYQKLNFFPPEKNSGNKHNDSQLPRIPLIVR